MDEGLLVEGSKLRRKLTVGAVAMGSAALVNTGGQYLLTVLLLKLGGVDLLGLSRFVASVFMIGESVSLPEASKVLIRQIRTGVHGGERFLRDLRFRWSLLPSAAFIGMGAYFLLTSGFDRGMSFLLIAFIAPALFGFEIVLSYLQAFENYRLLFVYAVVRALGCLGFAATACVLGAPPWVVVAATFSSYAIVAVVFFYTAVKSQPVIMAEEAKEQARKESLKLTVVSIINQVAEQADKILLGFALGDSMVGAYYAAVVVPRTVGFLIKPSVTVLNPHFVTKQIKLTVVYGAGLALTLIGAVIGIFSEQIVTIALGSVVSSYSAVTRIMFCSLGAYLAYQLLRNWALFNISCDMTRIRNFETCSCIFAVLYSLGCTFIVTSDRLLIFLAWVAPIRYLLGIIFYSCLRRSNDPLSHI